MALSMSSAAPPLSRRELLRRGVLSGAVVLVPTTIACARPRSSTPPTGAEPDDLPLARPTDWDPVPFNRRRGAEGAIPPEYMAKIDGEDGVSQHLGKHLPFIPEGVRGPDGMLALMWGDPSLGYARHPNSPATAEAPGHWYDWIRVRRATEELAEETESRFSSWPAAGPQDSGGYAAHSGDDPAADDGKNTVYLAVLPPDVSPGEWVRIHAHCLTHGEYVDFVQVPAAAPPAQ